ncbi:MAG: trypsin-like peptidase domain-containing protein [Clostridia bacterium]
MNEKIFVKEKKGLPLIAIILIVAIVGSFIGSAFTYLVLESKFKNSKGVTSDTTGKKYEINNVENPVVAIAENVGPSIVGVKIKSVGQNPFGALQESAAEGSGIIYSEDGYIITNYHVVESAINNSNASVEVTFPNSLDTCIATVIGGDQVTDLAVLKIDKTGLTKAEFGKSSDLKVGELAVAIGNPLGQEFAGSVTVGYVSALNRKLTTDGRTYKLIQTDAAINPGNSGGALVNSTGKVIGINTAKIGAAEVEGLGFAIPTDDALPIIQELITNKKIVRPYIGLTGMDLDAKTAKENSLPEGIYVASIINNSPAAKSGIQKGDIIVRVDSKDIKTMEKLNEIKNGKKVGDKMVLSVSRAGKEQDITVTLEADSTNTINNKPNSTINPNAR